MANSLDLKNLAELDEFKDRVKYNLIYVAHQIASEADTAPLYEKRQPYSISIINNPDGFVTRFSDSLAVQASIAQNIAIDTTPDPDILTYSGAQTQTAEFDAIDIEIQGAMAAIFNNLAKIA